MNKGYLWDADAHRKFMNAFKVDPFKFLDKIISPVIKHMTLDIIMFDGYLTDKYPVEYTGMSMHDFIVQKFGLEAMKAVIILAGMQED